MHDLKELLVALYRLLHITPWDTFALCDLCVRYVFIHTFSTHLPGTTKDLKVLRFGVWGVEMRNYFRRSED